MKIIFYFYFTIALQCSVHLEKDCNQNIMKYFGLKGVANPISYNEVKESLNYDFCPETVHSCCDKEDFMQTQKLWIEKN